MPTRKARRASSSRKSPPQRQPSGNVASEVEKGFGEVFKPYSGDLFGTRSHNPSGMIYLSRMKTDPYTAKTQTTTTAGDPGEIEHPHFSKKGTKKYEIDIDTQVLTQRNYASALCSLSWQPKARSRILQKGCVEALRMLSRLDDEQTRVSCATALRNLCQDEGIREVFVTMDGVPVIVYLGGTKRAKPLVKQDCMAALCVLSFADGFEEQMVRSGVMLALTNMVTDSNRDTIRICATTLLNLSSLQKSYAKSENVLETIKAVLEFLKLHNHASGGETGRLCLQALCNLAAHKEYQTRMVEEGAVRLINKLWQTGNPSSRYLCGVALTCLSNCKASRKTMVDQRVTGTLISLTEHGDERTQKGVLIALYRLSMSEESRATMVKEGAVPTLIRLSSLKFENAKPLCTSSLFHFSSSDLSRTAMLQDSGVVPAVMQLSADSGHRTQRNCAMTLANWLVLESSHDKLIDAGVIETLVRLSRGGSEQAREWAAVALYNLSCRPASCFELAKQGADAALVDALTSVKSVESQKMCAAALGNLTGQSLHHLVGIGNSKGDLEGTDNTNIVDEPKHKTGTKSFNAAAAIPVLIQLLKSGEAKHASTAVFNLAADSVNCDIMLTEGVLSALNMLALSDNYEVRLQCAALLCRLSYHDQCRKTMMQDGLVQAVITLSKATDPGTQHRCVSVLCNLACEGAMRPTLVAEGAVSALVSLSSSYNEHIRQGCAATLCNLACDDECQSELVQGSTVPALVILGLVASRSVDTEKFCAKALFNLLQSEKHLKRVLADNAMHGLSALKKCGDKETLYICSVAICNMAADEMGREKLMTPGVLKAIMELSRTKTIVTQRACANALLNLASVKAHHTALHNAGIVTTLTKVAQQNDQALTETCTLTLCLLTSHTGARKSIVNSAACSVIVDTTVLGDAECQEARAVALYNLAWYEDCRLIVIDKGALAAVRPLLESEDPQTITICVQALYNMSNEHANLKLMIAQGVLEVIDYILQYEYANDYMLQLCAHVLFNLSCDEENHVDMVAGGAVRMCETLWQAPDEDANEEDTKEMCALAVCNMACGQVNSRKMVTDGAVEILIQFTKWDLPGSQRKLAASFRNLLCPPGNQVAMVESGVMESLIHLASQARDRRDSRKGVDDDEESADAFGSTGRDRSRSTMSDDKSIINNCAKGLLIVSTNTVLREVVAENEEAKGIISASLNSKTMVDSQIDQSLLSEIEQESFKMGTQKTQQLGRAEYEPMPSIRTNLRLNESNAPPLYVDLRHLPWTRLDIEFHMAELEFPNSSLAAVAPAFSPDVEDEYELAEASVLYSKEPLPSDIYLLSKQARDRENDGRNKIKRGGAIEARGKGFENSEPEDVPVQVHVKMVVPTESFVSSSSLPNLRPNSTTSIRSLHVDAAPKGASALPLI